MKTVRKSSRGFLAATAVLIGVLVPVGAAKAQDTNANDWSLAQFASHEGNIGYLVLGVGLPLLTDGADGKNHALRTSDALGTSLILCEGLKYTVREKRPDSNERDSFPSGHVTAAFAVATAESAFHPRQAPLWYAGATLIGWSRLRLNRHYTQDVIAGAALGYLTSRFTLSRPRGLILTPFIDSKRGGVQIQFGGRF
jgi:hypothetical protein